MGGVPEVGCLTQGQKMCPKPQCLQLEMERLIFAGSWTDCLGQAPRMYVHTMGGSLAGHLGGTGLEVPCHSLQHLFHHTGAVLILSLWLLG